MNAPGSTASEKIWAIAPEQPEAVEKARRFADITLEGCDTEDRRATTMAVSEFAENLIKYGASAPGGKTGTIAISVDAELIRIRVTNTVISSDDARSVEQTVSRVASTADLESVYQDRLEELFQNPLLPRVRLGLLRVAFEGGFRLSCSFDPPLLEIVAERSRGSARRSLKAAGNPQ